MRITPLPPGSHDEEISPKAPNINRISLPFPKMWVIESFTGRFHVTLTKGDTVHVDISAIA